MSTGSEFDFGIGSSETQEPVNTPAKLPSDLAREQVNRRRAGRRRTRGDRGATDKQAGAVPGQDSQKRGAGRNNKTNDKAPVMQYPSYLVEERRVLRRKIALVAVCVVVITLVSLCVNDATRSLESPAEVFSCYALAVQQAYASVFNPASVLAPDQILAMHPWYFTLMNRVGSTFMTLMAGALLALAGALYQNLFRNPIAAPTMLGVSNGIQLGLALLVVVFGAAAAEMASFKYIYSYACVAVTLAALMFFSKLISGKGRPLNIVNMLLVGTILSQLIGVIINYINWYVLDDDLWAVYNELSEVLAVDTQWYAIAVMLGSAIVAIAPIWMMRFRLNTLSMDEEEQRIMGVDVTRMQVVVLTCGTVMMLTAQISMGTVSMISLVVPHVSRFFFGGEFRKQFAGDLLIGAGLLVLCRCIVSIVPFVGGGLPIGTVVNFVVLPAFVWILATQQRSWE